MGNSQKKKHKWLMALLKCLQSLTIREMKIKTILRFHFALARMSIIKKIHDNPNTWEAEVRGAFEFQASSGYRVRLCLHSKTTTTKTNQQTNYSMLGGLQTSTAIIFPKKLKMELPHDKNTPVHSSYHIDTGIAMLMSALFTTPWK